MVYILDSTFREGEQTPSVYFETHDKIHIAKILDRVGVDYIEAGHPLVSENIASAVKKIAHSGLKATIGAHSRSMREDVDKALECGVGFLGIFYCVSNGRLENVFKRSIDDAIHQISSVIEYAKKQKPDLIIRYTPEDTVRSPMENVVLASCAAVQSGADIISIADTTGYMVPGSQHNMFDYLSTLKEKLDNEQVNPLFAVHCHNDRGLALANALDAYRAGVDIIDASVLGLGERAGIVDLSQLLISLSTDFNQGKHWNLSLLPELYEVVSLASGIPIPVHFPIVGKNAFTHCAGVHTHAATKDPTHYQSLSPELVGRKMEVSLDHMSGIASLKYALAQIGEVDIDPPTILKILDDVKKIGEKRRTVSPDELRRILALNSS